MNYHTVPISKLLSPWREMFLVSALKTSFLNLIYHGAGTAVYLLVLNFPKALIVKEAVICLWAMAVHFQTQKFYFPHLKRSSLELLFVPERNPFHLWPFRRLEIVIVTHLTRLKKSFLNRAHLWGGAILWLYKNGGKLTRLKMAFSSIFVQLKRPISKLVGFEPQNSVVDTCRSLSVLKNCPR